MSEKYKVVVVEVVATSAGMLDIMTGMLDYLGEKYPPEKKISSGGFRLACERQAAAMHHMMDGDTPKDHLQLLEPQSKDWHTVFCAC